MNVVPNSISVCLYIQLSCFFKRFKNKKVGPIVCKICVAGVKYMLSVMLFLLKTSPVASFSIFFVN